MALRFTPQGQIGFFPEQQSNVWLLRELGARFPGAETLNLFAYSGLASLAALAGGLPVCHVDSSKGMVRQARENAAWNGLADHPVRWIEDDVTKFVQREQKRSRRYRGFVLDPPSYGRGAKTSEVWKIESHLPGLLQRLAGLCPDEGPAFVLLSAHTAGFGVERLTDLLRESFGARSSATRPSRSAGHAQTALQVHGRELKIPEEKGEGRSLPAGNAALLIAGEAAGTLPLKTRGWKRY